MTSYVQNGGHNVISRRKVLPSGECTRSASSVRQFLILSTFVLVEFT